ETPRMMMALSPEHTYRKLQRAAEMVAQKGVALMGLGAYTSVIGDAGETLAKRVPIGVTTGNSLTVASTLASLKQMAARLGKPMEQAGVLVIGATGSIGRACTLKLAGAVRTLVVAGKTRERVVSLYDEIHQKYPYSDIEGFVGTGAVDFSKVDYIITTTSSHEQVLDIMIVKPGTVIFDVALPPDIPEREGRKRPDVLVLEAGEMIAPEEPQAAYRLPLPPRVLYGCLTETALLALEGRGESYSIGRTIDLDKVDEIMQIAEKHGFEPAPFRSYGRTLSEQDLSEFRKRFVTTDSHG
ncbi:MAG: serine carboxypeptidase, partial [bacterium]